MTPMSPERTQQLKDLIVAHFAYTTAAQWRAALREALADADYWRSIVLGAAKDSVVVAERAISPVEAHALWQASRTKEPAVSGRYTEDFDEEPKP